jgi:hypothetical protein
MKKGFVPIFREIFALPNFFPEPFLSLGYKDNFTGENFPADFQIADLKDILIVNGLKDIKDVDIFDPRAELKYDLNLPVPAEEYERYRTLMDIGTLEHVFDTRQCLENSLRMVMVGGLYFLVTPVNGYLGHGLHTFNPELILATLKLNRYDVTYLKYSTGEGALIEKPLIGSDVLIWVVAKKLEPLVNFIVPQQEMWNTFHEDIGVQHK